MSEILPNKILAEEWLAKAEEDYEVALTLVRKRKRPTPSAVCFHAQQCAEKYLKAFLSPNGIPFPKTHDLLELYRLCLAMAPMYDLIGDLLDTLNPYSVEFRYPGEDATVEESREAVRIMREIQRFVRGTLGLNP